MSEDRLQDEWDTAYLMGYDEATKLWAGVIRKLERDIEQARAIACRLEAELALYAEGVPF